MAFKDTFTFDHSKSLGDVLKKILTKDNDQAELGKIKDENGNVLPYDTYLDQLIFQEEFETAHQFINDFKFQLSLHDHTVLVNQYINGLYDLDPAIRERNDLGEQQLEAIRTRLNDIL